MVGITIPPEEYAKAIKKAIKEVVAGISITGIPTTKIPPSTGGRIYPLEQLKGGGYKFLIIVDGKSDPAIFKDKESLISFLESEAKYMSNPEAEIPKKIKIYKIEEVAFGVEPIKVTLSSKKL